MGGNNIFCQQGRWLFKKTRTLEQCILPSGHLIISKWENGDCDSGNKQINSHASNTSLMGIVTGCKSDPNLILNAQKMRPSPQISLSLVFSVTFQHTILHCCQ